ncbi:MAG: hypothetical protein EOO06_10945 [Chitinophagaceae bacterium]|nr:MAG: hypothetical protein EOO06_10945 [Chitinophagaceae bacterium]
MSRKRPFLKWKGFFISLVLQTMVKQLTLFFLACAFKLLATSLYAQADSKNWFSMYADTTKSNRQISYYIVEWDPATALEFPMLLALDAHTAIVQADLLLQEKIVKSFTQIAPANNLWKIPGGSRQYLNDRVNRVIVSGANLKAIELAIKNQLSSTTILQQYPNALLVKLAGRNQLESLLQLPAVQFVDCYVKPGIETNIIGYDRSFHGISALDYLIPRANGRGVTVSVKEQRMEPTDLDLYKRVLPSALAAATVSAHATVIASIIGGAGNSFYDGRGIANGCSFFSSNFDNLFPDSIVQLTQNNVSVQNHSYGTVIQNYYGAEAAAYDAQLFGHPTLLHVFSAGNRGQDGAAAGIYAGLPGFANLTGNFKMAKNVITVGAVNNTGTLAAESSAGPLYDGRLAPQLAALGPNGTSDAAAMLSGTLAVMQQLYGDSNAMQKPAASLLKALLYNTADDIYSKGIDFKSGYGLLNSYEAVRALQQKKYAAGAIANGQPWSTILNVPAGIASLKLTLAWTDSAAPLNNYKALVNDIDLEVSHMAAGTVYKPWILNSSANADSLRLLPVRGRDSLNTAEQISLERPAPGAYEIRVSASSATSSLVNFHVAWQMDTIGSFYFTNPQHASDANREENEILNIKWKAAVADTNQTGDLSISYDAGVHWLPVVSNYRIFQQKYQWPIKDTNSMAQLKMQTAYGSFYSKQFIMAKLTRPTVDFNCSDSLRLSWNKHVYANSYKIFALADSPYLKEVTTVSDSFVVMDRAMFPYNVYAIEPVLSNGILASRSVAIDVNLQGVACFYKTFYYNLADSNRLNLVLELSSPVYVDSIYFEQVTAMGQRLRQAGAQKADGRSLYDQAAGFAPAGISYWRARIKLRSGDEVLTPIIEVLTTGEKMISFYPNPVPRNGTVRHLLKQGLGSDARLYLYDIAGRLLKKYSSIPDNFNFRTMPAGLLIYRLYSPKDELLETGKILLQ